jgi:hypothetical protein
MKWMDAQAFNVPAVQKQTNVPGGIGEFQRQPGTPVNELIFIEPTPTHQPTLPEFIQFFFSDYPEMLSGALPSLFGAESNTDTVGGISMQRDQALGRLASPWGALQWATSVYHRQAVQQAAKCREKLGQTQISESIPGKGPVSVEISDLKGNVLCFPETDSNFPETWVQRSSRFQQLISEAGANPWIAKLLSVPNNMKIAKDAVGLEELEVPEADALDKQQGEFELLLKTGPVPNPKVLEAQQQFEQAMAQAKAAGQEQQFAQTAPQVLQQIASLPQKISSVQVAQDASEDHETEALGCFIWMNGPEGRKFKRGTEDEQASFENVHLHWQAHTEMAAKLKAQQEQPQKPPSESVSVAVDKMPPNVGAELLSKYYGIQAKPEDFMAQDAAETEQEITKKAADFGHGVIAPGPAAGAELHA